MKIKHITTLLLGGVATVGLTACSDKEDGKPGFFKRFYNDFLAEMLGDAPEKEVKAMPPLMNISVMNLQRADVPLYATWFGQLRGTQQADIKPEVAGRIVSQDYIDGSPCENGDPLFHIDDETYKAAYDMAAANLAAAEATEAQAKIADEQAQQDVDRYASLVGTGSVAEKTYIDAQHAKKRSAALWLLQRHINCRRRLL